MRNKIIKAIIYILLGVISFLLLYKAFITMIPQLWQILKSGNESDIETFLSSGNKWSGLSYLAMLQFVQVISIVIPSAPIRIAGGMVYGIWRSFLTCHLSYVLANYTVFYLVRRFHASVAAISKAGEKRQQKLMEMLDRGDPFLMVVLACMVPAVPNGIIPYAAANTKLTIRDFTLAVYFGSLMPALVMCAIGRQILSGEYVPAIILFAGNFLLIYIMHKNKDKLNRLIIKVREKWIKNKKITNENIENIKENDKN